MDYFPHGSIRHSHLWIMNTPGFSAGLELFHWRKAIPGNSGVVSSAHTLISNDSGLALKATSLNAIINTNTGSSISQELFVIDTEPLVGLPYEAVL